MRQLRVPLKRRLIHPLGMNRKHNRLVERLLYAHRQTTRLRARRLVYPQHLLAKLRLVPRLSLKADKKMNGQGHLRYLR